MCVDLTDCAWNMERICYYACQMASIIMSEAKRRNENEKSKKQLLKLCT